MTVHPGLAQSLAQQALDQEKQRFVASLVSSTDVFVEPPKACDPCKDLEHYALADVVYASQGFCIGHANSELVLDQGRHGYLALPALAFSGADRG